MQEYTNDLPLRGPKLYEQDNWEYTNAQQGTLERFAGLEEIYFNDKLVYKAHYHGGSIE